MADKNQSRKRLPFVSVPAPLRPSGPLAGAVLSRPKPQPLRQTLGSHQRAHTVSDGFMRNQTDPRDDTHNHTHSPEVMRPRTSMSGSIRSITAASSGHSSTRAASKPPTDPTASCKMNLSAHTWAHKTEAPKRKIKEAIPNARSFGTEEPPRTNTTNVHQRMRVHSPEGAVPDSNGEEDIGDYADDQEQDDVQHDWSACMQTSHAIVEDNLPDQYAKNQASPRSGSPLITHADPDVMLNATVDDNAARRRELAKKWKERIAVLTGTADAKDTTFLKTAHEREIFLGGLGVGIGLVNARNAKVNMAIQAFATHASALSAVRTLNMQREALNLELFPEQVLLQESDLMVLQQIVREGISHGQMLMHGVFDLGPLPYDK